MSKISKIEVLDNIKAVMLGDLHFGKNKFSKMTFSSQMAFFNEQLYPYMEENNINTIIQLGDVFDNRIMMDIEYFDILLRDFYDVLKAKNINFICIVGNHDIYHKSSREYTPLNIIDRLYDNVYVINERKELLINNMRCLFVPWILPNEELKKEELKGINYLLGHFEIRNFEMTKGHIDEHSMLSPEFFKQTKSLKQVFSGHYHIKSDKEKITYLGTPYWLDWGDYNTTRGFYVIDENFKVNYIENNKSVKFVKIKYNDSNKEFPITISGYDFKKEIYCNLENLSEISGLIKYHKIKFFINESKENQHEEYIYLFKQQGLDFEITNNVEISNIIGETYISNDEQKVDLSKITSSTGLIKDTVKKSHPHLIPILDEMFREIEESK